MTNNKDAEEDKTTNNSLTAIQIAGILILCIVVICIFLGLVFLANHY